MLFRSNCRESFSAWGISPRKFANNPRQPRKNAVSLQYCVSIRNQSFGVFADFIEIIEDYWLFVQALVMVKSH